MKKPCPGTGKEMSTQEGLIESLNLFSHQLENLNKILTQITSNPTSRLTSIIILPSRSLIWFMKIQIWSNRFKASLFQQQMQLVLVKRSSNLILTITVRIEIEVTWPLSSQLTSREGQWQVKTLTSQSLKLRLVLNLQIENNFMGSIKVITSHLSLSGMREGLALLFQVTERHISVEELE